MEIHEYITLYFVIVFFVLTPGLGVLAVVTRAISGNSKYSYFFAFGLVLGDLVYLFLVLFSIASVAHIIAPYMYYIRIVGASYLFYLGFRQILSKTKSIEKTKISKKETGLLMSIITGFLISGTNPKVILFYIGLLPLFIPLDSLNFELTAYIFITVLSGLLTGLFIIVAIANKIAILANNSKKYNLINKILGFLIIAVGIMLIS